MTGGGVIRQRVLDVTRLDSWLLDPGQRAELVQLLTDHRQDPADVFSVEHITAGVPALRVGRYDRHGCRQYAHIPLRTALPAWWQPNTEGA